VLKASAAIISEASIAGAKFVMDQRGYHGGIPRLPMVPPSEASKRRMLEMLETLATLEPATVRA
jgi:dihydrodipicolinate synthase/N-acetylneuraminate lyase